MTTAQMEELGSRLAGLDAGETPMSMVESNDTGPFRNRPDLKQKHREAISDHNSMKNVLKGLPNYLQPGKDRRRRTRIKLEYKDLKGEGDWKPFEDETFGPPSSTPGDQGLKHSGYDNTELPPQSTDEHNKNNPFTRGVMDQWPFKKHPGLCDVEAFFTRDSTE